MKSKPTISKPTETAETVLCRACGHKRPWEQYRLFSGTPRVYFDFCTWCEQEHGTLTLYRRYNAYGTAAVVDAVFRAAKVPDGKRTADQERLLVKPVAVPVPKSNEEIIAREIQRREMCRRRLVYFTTTMHPDYLPGWAHQDICRRLERFVAQIEAQQAPRLIIAMPPRLGKSLLASDMFPSWVLGKHPEWGIIGSSYAQSLPLDFSRNIRDRLGNPEYNAIFPEAKLRQDAKGIEAWKTTRGGGYIAAGVGTGINGKGMHLGIGDDLIKDAEEASSELIRQNTYNWFRSVFRTRLAPGGGILLIGTRWHFDDVTGRELTLDETLEKAGVPPDERENWELVSYPAIAEADEYLLKNGVILQGKRPDDDEDVMRKLRNSGEALHPERWPLREMVKLRNGMSKALWSALYQQQPTPDDGDFFKRGDFQYRWLDPAYRPLCRLFLCVDYAIGKKQRNDFTVAAVFALTSEDDLYCLEMRRGRWGTDDIASNIVALVERHKPEIYAGEQGQLHAAVWPVIEKALKAKRLYISVNDTLVPVQDKEARARPLQARTQRQKFFFSFDGRDRPSEYDITEREMLQFPNGAHDDTVDCLAWAARLALNVSLPRAQAPPKKPKSWRDSLTVRSPTNDHMTA
jgi:predicted phage terminase large subunit-like protein